LLHIEMAERIAQIVRHDAHDLVAQHRRALRCPVERGVLQGQRRAERQFFREVAR
jgi:hypothetical protein